MANRRETSQFIYSYERRLTSLLGSFQQSGSVGAFAALTAQGVTYTAVKMGAAGNSITVQITPGATAGAEVVTVSGNAISVQIQSGVSSITQVRTAVNASAAAAALVLATGTSASTVATAAAAPLIGGVDTVFIQNGAPSAFSLSQIGTGVYQIQLADPYQALLAAGIMLQRATAVSLGAQLQSVDVQSAKQIVFRMQATGTPTNMAANDILYIDVQLRNSSQNT